MTPGERIKREIEAYDFSQFDLALAMRVSIHSVGLLVSDKRRITKYMADRLEMALPKGPTSQEWLKISAEYRGKLKKEGCHGK
jgi:plasmid maintenance system antidote protein VapI